MPRAELYKLHKKINKKGFSGFFRWLKYIDK